jgi:hypothetical protein
MKSKALALALLAAALSGPGCTSISKTRDGWKYSNGLFSKTAKSIELEGGTNGTYRVRVEGYRSEADKMIDLAREAIALGKAAAPVPVP